MKHTKKRHKLLSLFWRRVCFKWFLIHKEVSKESLSPVPDIVEIPSIFNGMKWKEHSLILHTTMNGELEIFSMIRLGALCGTSCWR